MTHEEKRIYLIRELLAELPDCSGMGIPDHEGGTEKASAKSYEYSPAPAGQRSVPQDTG